MKLGGRIMSNKYAGTKTEKNLETAFAGESMARNKKDLSRLQPSSQKQQIMKKNMRNYGSKNLVESVRLMKI